MDRNRQEDTEDFFGYNHCYFKLNPHTLMHTQALTLKTVFIT